MKKLMKPVVLAGACCVMAPGAALASDGVSVRIDGNQLKAQLSSLQVNIEQQREQLRKATDTFIDQYYSVIPTGKVDVGGDANEAGVTVHFRLDLNKGAAGKYLRELEQISDTSQPFCMKITINNLLREIHLPEENCVWYSARYSRQAWREEWLLYLKTFKVTLTAQEGYPIAESYLGVYTYGHLDLRVGPRVTIPNRPGVYSGPAPRNHDYDGWIRDLRPPYEFSVLFDKLDQSQIVEIANIDVSPIATAEYYQKNFWDWQKKPPQ